MYLHDRTAVGNGAGTLQVPWTAVRNGAGTPQMPWTAVRTGAGTPQVPWTAVRSGAEIGLLSLRLNVSQGATLGDFPLIIALISILHLILRLDYNGELILIMETCYG